MQTTWARGVLVLFILMLSATSWAQRGGGRGGGGGNAGSETAVPPKLLTAYDSTDYGLKFPAPPRLSMYTPEVPGPFRQMFTERKIVYLVDLMGNSASVSVKYSPGVSDADLKGLKDVLETNPPQAKLPGFRKISLRTIKVGAAGDKEAVEYVYSTTDKDVTNTTRQVVFVHNGRGFTFSCVAPERDYAAADKRSFQPLFTTIEFK